MELKFLYGYVMTSPIHLLALDEIGKLNLDVIHAQTEFGVGIFARICARKFDIPLVSTYHTTYEDYTHYGNFTHLKAVDNLSKKGVASLSRMYGDSSEEVIAPSHKTKEMLEHYNVHRQINVIPTGLQLEKFSPVLKDEKKRSEIRREAGFGDQDIMIIYVGRLAKEKSMDVVVDGFEKASALGINVKLMIVGGGPDLEPLKTMVKKKNLGDMIVLTGPKPSSEVPDYYRSADAFISASLSETQGMTFIEAMAAGIPLFARRDEVLEDLIDEGKTGWFFRDSDDLILTRLEETEHRGWDTPAEPVRSPAVFENLPPEIRRYTVAAGEWDATQPEKSLRDGAAGGHHGSHPHLVHEFVRSILEERAPAIHMEFAANVSAAGILAHASALSGGREIDIPEF